MCRMVFLLLAFVAFLCRHRTRADVKVVAASLRPQPGLTVFTECRLSNRETFVGWFKADNTQITSSSTAAVRVERVDATTYKLTFADVKVEEGGEYECRGSLNNKATFELHVGFDASKVDLTQHIKIGQQDTITFGVRGYPKPQITWKKGGRTLNPANDARYKLLNDGSLTIVNVTVSDQGNYTVTVKQGGYLDEKQIEVYAVEHPTIVAFPAPKKFLTKGYPAVFVCKASGRPPPKYQWLNPKGNEITSFANFEISGGNLTIKKVDKDLNGTYTCRAYNVIEKTGEQIGEVREVVDIVNIYEPPMITSSDGDKEVSRGASFSLECKAKGSPKPTVEWTRNGERDPRQKMSEGQSVIEFKNIQIGDAGKYICEARSSALDDDGKVIVDTFVRNLNIRSPPFINVQASPNQVFSYIGNIKPTYVSCTFGGYPKPWVVMTFRKKLKSNATARANVSVITDAKAKFGYFHCQAKNIYGVKNQTIELKEVGKPGVVQDFAADATCDSVELTWNPPLKDGGMPITKFVLNYEDVTRNVDASETSHTVTNLARNEEYTFIIRATNEGEWGPTTTTNIKTNQYCAPGRPIIYQPKGTLIDTTSFTLKWRKPQDTGGDNEIEYIVKYRDQSEAKPGPWKEFKTKELEYQIKDLDRNKKYKFEVIAKNRGGESNPDERFYRINVKPEPRSSQSRLVASVMVTFISAILLLL